ncbi:hypothetical protein SADUNF_Sadunf15G0120100 [Salix dunnii]|uniref:Uncharacterized protein n=1 Tax=Salix dunnii TaxID=1413687 RepID=A0A835JFD8_9ROSI|nr:hypothetical protein SADUNF_Sadunf15G0120100 [Salix dunnii]
MKLEKHFTISMEKMFKQVSLVSDTHPCVKNEPVLLGNTAPAMPNKTSTSIDTTQEQEDTCKPSADVISVSDSIGSNELICRFFRYSTETIVGFPRRLWLSSFLFWLITLCLKSKKVEAGWCVSSFHSMPSLVNSNGVRWKRMPDRREVFKVYSSSRSTRDVLVCSVTIVPSDPYSPQ